MRFSCTRHRIILSYEAEAEGITSDYFIAQLIARIAVP
jgi:MoxR-like ATPase